MPSADSSAVPEGPRERAHSGPALPRSVTAPLPLPSLKAAATTPLAKVTLVHT